MFTKFIRKRSSIIMLCLLFLSLSLCSCLPDTSAAGPAAAGSSDSSDASVTVHFIDVGQADSILIQSDGENMLIDAGTNDAGAIVVDYLHSQGITTLNWIIGTHPHEDHIGGLDDVIRSFNVQRVMLPEKEHTTKTFEDVLDAVIEKDLGLTAPVVGDTYALGNCTFTILGPAKDYGDDLNNWSVSIKLVCKETSFVFTGDAENEAEADMCSAGIDLNADVLKLGHHGSYTSSSDEFLEAVSPDFVVISVGQDNDYGHPHKTTMDKLYRLGVDIYRTDMDGTVVAVSDGKHVTFSTENNTMSGQPMYVDPASLTETQTDSGDMIVHVTNSGKKYHLAGCDSLARSDIPITLKEAKEKGYTPCKACNPPQ